MALNKAHASSIVFSFHVFILKTARIEKGQQHGVIPFGLAPFHLKTFDTYWPYWQQKLGNYKPLFYTISYLLGVVKGCNLSPLKT